MKIGQEERRERIEAFVQELNRISFKQKNECILGDFIEILEGRTYDQIVKEVGEMSTGQMVDYAVMTLESILDL